MVYDQIAAVRLKGDGNVRSLISDLEVLCDRLGSMADKVSESQRVVKLMGTVSVEYESVVTALRTVSDKLTWDGVAARLQDEYDCRVSSSPNKKQALKAQEVYQRNYKPRCYGCGKLGHKVRDCNKENVSSDEESDNAKRKSGARKSSAKKAVDKKEKKKYRTLIAIETSGEMAMHSRVSGDRHEAPDEFLIDSGASSHMSATYGILTM